MRPWQQYNFSHAACSEGRCYWGPHQDSFTHLNRLHCPGSLSHSPWTQRVLQKGAISPTSLDCPMSSFQSPLPQVFHILPDLHGPNQVTPPPGSLPTTAHGSPFYEFLLFPLLLSCLVSGRALLGPSQVPGILPFTGFHCTEHIEMLL